MQGNELIAVSLKHLLDTQHGDTLFNVISSNFSCEKNHEIEIFLESKARDLHGRDITRTYLVAQSNEFNNPTESFSVLGYFTLSLKNLNFSENISKTRIKDLTSNKGSENGVGFLIGQFGKNDFRASEVSGRDIMEIAIDEIHKAHDIVGGRFVFLDCMPIEKIVNFYKREGFSELSSLVNGEGYLQMFCRIPVKKMPELVVERDGRGLVNA